MIQLGYTVWHKASITLQQTIGRSTIFTKWKGGFVEFGDGTIKEINFSQNITITRIISRIQKRKGSGPVNIEIYKNGGVVVK